MLPYETAKDLYEQMKHKAPQCTVSSFPEFFKMFLKSAADYAATRTAWATMNQAQRNEDDKPRRAKHDAFIAMLNAISRNLDISDTDILLPDRKPQGDFACYIALFLALEQR